jgi:hypothetical protein
LNLLQARNRNWRALIESDNNERPATTPTVEEPRIVIRTIGRSTPHARVIIELLEIPPSGEVLDVIERAVENKAAKETIGVNAAANDIFVSAALVKIARPPDSWLTWFQQLSEETATATHTT